MPTVETR